MNPKMSFYGTLAFVTVLAACNKASDKGAIVKPLSDDTVIVEFEGGKVTAKDVAKEVESDLRRLNEQAIQAYKQNAERQVFGKLIEAEAKNQGLSSPNELFNKLGADTQVSDQEVKDFMKQNNLEKGVKDPKTGKMQKVSGEEIKRYLESQKRRQAQEGLVQGLMAKAKVKHVLQEPREKIEVDADAPSLGSKSAKVVIHEFSDFECPFCARGSDIVKQIHQAYGDKVLVQFRHFPLDFHQNAKPAAVAATCAQQQNKFWEMHDRLFANQQGLNTDNFKKWAGEIGLDAAKFEECLKDSSGAIAKLLAKDQGVAEKLGVNSTPTFFVNGKRVAGALPFDQFKTMIDSELN